MTKFSYLMTSGRIYTRNEIDFRGEVHSHMIPIQTWRFCAVGDYVSHQIDTGTIRDAQFRNLKDAIKEKTKNDLKNIYAISVMHDTHIPPFDSVNISALSKLPALFPSMLEQGVESQRLSPESFCPFPRVP